MEFNKKNVDKPVWSFQEILFSVKTSQLLKFPQDNEKTSFSFEKEFEKKD